jgi:hypothetical protein
MSRWLILLINVIFLAVVSFMAYYFNFNRGYYADPELPYDFKVKEYVPDENAGLTVKEDRKKDDYASIEASAVIKPPPPDLDNEDASQDTEGVAKLKEVVTDIIAIVYDPKEPEKNGCYLKLEKKVVYYFQVNDRITYGDKDREKVFNYWLDEIKPAQGEARTEDNEDKKAEGDEKTAEPIRAADKYEIVFRDDKGGKHPLEFERPAEKSIFER